MKTFSFTISSDKHAACAFYYRGRLAFAEAVPEEIDSKTGDPIRHLREMVWVIREAVHMWDGADALDNILRAALLEIGVNYGNDDEIEMGVKKALDTYFANKRS